MLEHSNKEEFNMNVLERIKGKLHYESLINKKDMAI